MPDPNDLPELEALAQAVHTSTLTGRADAALARFKARQSHSLEQREAEFRNDARTRIREGIPDIDPPAGIPLTRAWEIVTEEAAGHQNPAPSIDGKDRKGNPIRPTTPPPIITLVPPNRGIKGDRDRVAIPSHLSALKLHPADIKRATFLIEDLRTSPEGSNAPWASDSTRTERSGPPAAMSQGLLDLLARKYNRHLPPMRNIQVAGGDEREMYLNPHVVIAQPSGLEPHRMRVLMIENATALLDHQPLTIAARRASEEAPWPLPNDTLILVAYENAGVRILDHHVITGTLPRSTKELTWYTTIPVVADAADPTTEDVDLSDDLDSSAP